MATALILGAGVMGSAFTLPLADAGTEVRLVGTPLDVERIARVKADGVHPGLRVPLPPSVRAYQHDELTAAMDDSVDIVILGVSSAGIDWATGVLKEALPGPRPLMLLTKGLAADGRTIRPLTEPIGKALGCPTGGVGGPCIAGELAVRRDTSVVFAHEDEPVRRRLLDMTSVGYYHARPSGDVTGTEVCAALKNFYALGIGAAAGLLERHGKGANGAMMHNVAAGLFTQALLELAQINALLGGTPASVHGLPGTGDLYVTVQGGRNSRMGKLLGEGWRYRAAKTERMAEDTVEGAELALCCGPTLEHLMAEGWLDRQHLPLTCAIVDAVMRDGSFTVDWGRFYAA